MTDPSLLTLGLLCLAAFCAGWIDAVVGGGGVIQLPALLLGLPGASPVQVLATNKLSSVLGTSTAAATYARRLRPRAETWVPLAGAAFSGAVGGAFIGSVVPREAFTPLTLATIIIVGAYVLLKPDLGDVPAVRFSGRRHAAVAAVIGFVIGVWDGMMGPGTGSFLVFGLVTVMGFGFLQATAHAKVANFATNLAALVVFIPMGAVIWHVGLVIGAANVLGGYLGARAALKQGSGFVKVLLVVVLSVFTVKLSVDLCLQYL